MRNNKFKLPSKAMKSNKRNRTIKVESQAYYDNLPKGLDAKTCDSVHDWDDTFLAATLVAGSAKAEDFKKGVGNLTVELPHTTCNATFSRDEDPIVVIKNVYPVESQVGLALKALTKAASQTTS